MYSKRVGQPLAFGVGSGMPPSIDIEAIHVHKYAVEHRKEDVEQSAEAGDTPEPSTDPPAALPSTAIAMDVSADAHGQKRVDDGAPGHSPKRTRFADKGFALLESTFLPDDTPAGESAPKTPKRDTSPDKGQVNQVTSTDLSLYEHKDQAVSFTFKDDELDELETYEMNFGNDELYDDGDWIDDDAIMSQLTFPFSKHEPSFDDSELQRLDALADSLEIQRLTKMAVLTDAATMPPDSKQFFTRFARTWREKIGKDGQQIWLRRSRFVAREFAWMDSERDSLFSPASNSIVARLLTVMYLAMKQHAEAVMASIDVKDAFLTVKQKTPTVFTCKLADGREVQYGLGRVLPGQIKRDGSLLWHQDITKELCEELGMSQHVPYPCILKTADSSCFVLIHVDDILVVGRREFVLQKMVKCLQQRYEVSTQLMEKPGDEVSFLKRRITLQHDDRITMETHHKHVDQMCSLLGLNRKLQN